MQGYNVIMVYSPNLDQLLFCKRTKNPYKGLYNLVGGKIEKNESSEEAAYRELFEETGITKSDIKLNHFFDITYYYQDCYVEIFVGKLNNEVQLIEEKNSLFWSDLNQNFFGPMYAGEGNIGHMVEQVKLYQKELFNKKV
ncbi:MAG: NUDIX hydrolase [Bacilli bacterium]